ncbi:deoxyribodipyrimidine photo-lyase [Luminiphilus sp.]|nr:deoxyribodipyrimidine photo-lyase [Luminiphilus sp.]
MPDVSLYWFRDDLRLSDLPGLAAAASQGAVLPVYIRDTDLGGEWKLGGASRWWLHHSLDRLQRDLNALGVPLILRTGDTLTSLCQLANEVGARQVYCSRQYQPWAAELERTLRDALQLQGISLKRYPGTLLHEPENIATGSGTPFKVFTPFWRACGKAPPPQQPLPIPPLSTPPRGYCVRITERLGTVTTNTKLGIRVGHNVGARGGFCQSCAHKISRKPRAQLRTR